MLNIAELSKIKVDDLSKFISSKISSLDHQILLLEYKSKNNLSFGIFENKNLIADMQLDNNGNICELVNG